MNTVQSITKQLSDEFGWIDTTRVKSVIIRHFKRIKPLKKVGTSNVYTDQNVRDVIEWFRLEERQKEIEEREQNEPDKSNSMPSSSRRDDNSVGSP